MTGYGSLFEMSDCRDAGFDDYFLKPIDLRFSENGSRSFAKSRIAGKKVILVSGSRRIQFQFASRMYSELLTL